MVSLSQSEMMLWTETLLMFSCAVSCLQQSSSLKYSGTKTWQQSMLEWQENHLSERQDDKISLGIKGLELWVLFIGSALSDYPKHCVL